MSKKIPPVKFNINDFLSYYKNPANYDIDTTQNIITNFYILDKTNKVYIKKERPLSQKYITINGEKLYITNYIDRDNIEHILFTIPVEIDGKWWDNHYHFGINNDYRSRRTTKRNRKRFPVIFFHKTIQIPNDKRMAINCFFQENIDLNRINISDIKCESHDINRMKDEFAINSDDFMYLHELIRRPFYGIKKGGKNNFSFLKKTLKNIKKRKTKKNRYY